MNKEINNSELCAMGPYMPIVSIIVESICNILGRQTDKTEAQVLEDLVVSHIEEVQRWAETYDFMGLGSPKTTNGESIPLRLASLARKYRSDDSNNKVVSIEEERIITTRSSIVLLGDPGSGKTTTLKRTALGLLNSEPSSDADHYRCPILVILKEIEIGISPVCETIARRFGIDYSFKDFYLKKDSPPVKRAVIGSISLDDAIAKILNEINGILLLDGLDELSHETRNVVEKEVSVLSRKLSTSKILISCRSGDYKKNFNGFNVYEIMPLNPEQIQAIADVWLSDAGLFIKELEKCPYKDIVDRPLLLTFLLFIFTVDEQLPEQPALVYRRVVYRLLREWDEERSIMRKSRYAKFDADRKIDFLSELSYYLTCRMRNKVFSQRELSDAYRGICDSFSLPYDECEAVANEIESHTGIIINAGFDRYQFSHLSLQEYFCANYLVRAPFPDLMEEYMNTYPAPLAVACAISSDPGRFFISIIEHPYTCPHIASTSQRSRLMLISFLSRLRLEKPLFKVDASFGKCVLYLFSIHYAGKKTDIEESLEFLLMVPEVTNSVIKCLKNAKRTIKPQTKSKFILIQLDPMFTFNKALTSRLPVRLPRIWWRENKAQFT